MPRPSTRRWASLSAVLLGLVSAASPARADVFDLTLARLIKTPAAGAAADPASDPSALAAYRQLLSELSVGLAPRILSPADTIGWSGFQFDLDYSFTSISSGKCSDPGTAGQPKNQDQCPWQFGVDGGRDGQGNRTAPPGLLHTLSVVARKGIWLVVPSLEIGAGGTALLQSSIYAINVYAKLALHEGYHDWPIPSLAIRGSAARVLGAASTDLTMVQVDASISKSFGIAGSVTLVPYLGAAWLYIVPRSQPVDVTPGCNAYSGRGCTGGITGGPTSGDLNNDALFPSTANADITRWRMFAGFRLNYSVLVITTDVIATTCGDISGTNCPAAGAHGNVAVPDNSPWQWTFSASVGTLF